ncbi:MAG: SAM-dependent chlorinase/fluorinase [gamma proteobacterium symbiont of Bathyaustriella thionipta]|nr:SAM-dependent chlorinase/fluorinase [gamma proteobacterium symbiont of Bathyaustriella thionipta]
MALVASFTDFGSQGPYQGQMQAALKSACAQIELISLMADAPLWQPQPAAYLLAALARDMPPDCHYLAVVDPGVGGDRHALAIHADGRWLVGPDNGLLVPLVRQSQVAVCYRIQWQPQKRSDSFHGRDWFAPALARLICARPLPCEPLMLDDAIGMDWPQELAQVIYIDHYGNLMSGLQAANIPRSRVIRLNGHKVRFARTFSEVPVGEAFWFANAFGLLEIAINRGQAGEQWGIRIGDAILQGEDQ